MKITELCQLGGDAKIGVQNVLDSIINAKQGRGFVKLEIGTDCLSMQEIATGKFESVVFMLRISKADYDAAIARATGESNDA